MSYLVLARKYRPQTFSEVVGQEHVTRTLANAFASGRVHHAFLFCGPRGCGKTTLARIVGKALNCENGPSAEPCGTCTACASISAGSAIDYQEMDGASNRGIDAIRELTEAVRYQPAVLRKKVYVIDEVHMLTTEAFNALLKTLEEPPPHVTFVLATTEPHKLPNTILSRCQRYDFKLVPGSRLAGHLTRIFDAEKLAIEAGAVSLLVRESGGSVRDALSLSDQLISYVGTTTITEKHVAEVLGVADRALTRTLVRSLASGEAGTALGAVESAIERGVDEVQLARAIVRYLRDLSVLQVAPDRPELVDASDEERAELRTEAGSLERSRIAQMFERMLRCCDDLGKTLQPRLVLDCALIDVATVEPLIPLGDLVERLSELEARLTRGGASSSAGSRSQPARPAQPGPAHPAQPGPAHPGPAHPGPAHPGPAHPAPAHPAPAHPAPAQSAPRPAQPAPAHLPVEPRAEQPEMSMTARLEQHLEASISPVGGGSSATTRTVVSAVADAARKPAPAFATGTAPGVRGPSAPPLEQPIAAASSTSASSTSAVSTLASSTSASSPSSPEPATAKPESASAKAPDKDKPKPPKRKPEFADGSGVRGGESNERAPGRPEMAAGSGVRGAAGGEDVTAAIAEARAARDAALAGGMAESKSSGVPPGRSDASRSDAGRSDAGRSDAGRSDAGIDHSMGDVPPMPAHLMADIPHAADGPKSSTSPMKMTAPHASGAAAMAASSPIKSTASGSGPHPSPMKSTLPGAGVPAAKPAAASGPISMQPSGPVPAPSSTASGSGPTGSSEPLSAAPADLLKAWNAVLGELETRRRFTLLGPFQHARVMKWGADVIELGFPVDVHSMGEMAAEKSQIDELTTIVRELGSELGRVRIAVRMLDASESNQGTRSVLEDTRAKSAIERGKRESEAREHPITKHVLQTFGAQIKEIKTDV